MWFAVFVGSIFIADAIRQANGIKPWLDFGTEYFDTPEENDDD